MPYALSSFYFTFYILLFVLHVRFHNKYNIYSPTTLIVVINHPYLLCPSTMTHGILSIHTTGHKNIKRE